MEIYLFNEDGSTTGEVFYSWDEVFDWVKEQIGHLPSPKDRIAISHGRHFAVGNRYFFCLAAAKEVFTAAA